MVTDKQIVEEPPNASKRSPVRFPIYPFVIGIYPIISLYTANQHRVALVSEFLPWFFLTLFAQVCLCLILYLLIKDRKKSALLAMFIGLWWLALELYALPLSKQLIYWYPENLWHWRDFSVKCFWFVGMLAGILLLSRIKYVTSRLHSFLTNTSIILLAISIFSITASEINKTSIDKKLAISRDNAYNAAVKPNTHSPNIYFLVLDAYARGDSLKRNFDFDNSQFLTSLRNRGFYVSENNWSNYCLTRLSISSTLNLNYLDNITVQGQQIINVSKQEGDDIALKLVEHSTVSRLLRKLGYRFIVVSPYFTDFEGADTSKTAFLMCMMNAPSMGAMRTDFEFAAFQMLTLYYIMYHIQDYVYVPALDPERLMRRKFALDAIDIVKNSSDKEVPVFVFAHILAPHPPFIFKKDGGIGSGAMVSWDGSEYFKRSFSSKETYKVQYIDQLQWANQRVLEIVDTIQKQSTRPSIIIIEGDHGSGLNYDCEKLEKTNVCERFANLMALKVPKETGQVNPALVNSPVNIFRFIFSQYFSLDYPLLPDRHYYSPDNAPFEFVDISKTIAQCSKLQKASKQK